MSRLKKRIADFTNYSENLQVPLIRVLFDYLSAFVLNGFTIWDYLEISSGMLLSKYERRRFLTYKRMQKILKKVNDSAYDYKLINKPETLKTFSEYVKRCWVYPKESTLDEFVEFINKNKIVIVKPVDGMCGEGIFKKDYTDISESEIEIDYRNFVTKNLLVEECITVHKALDLNNKSNKSLNTFRVFTMMDSRGEVHILKAKFRAGVGNSIVDAADGSVHYPISVEYGIVEGPGVVLESINKDDFIYCHPGCEKIMVGMRIPYWEDVRNMLEQAAKKIPQLRLIGWDVAITEKGPEIIEANHNPYHGTFEELGNKRLWYYRLRSLM